ncbi:MAG: hypothetical protein ABIG10_01230 [bacterium]
MMKKLLNQRGSAMLIVMLSAMFALTIAMTVLLTTSAYVKSSKQASLAWSSFDAWESCVQNFITETKPNRTAQTENCLRGQCIDFVIKNGCISCGSANAELLVGDCKCDMEFEEKYQDPISYIYYTDFIITGFCNSGDISFRAPATLETCVPVCVGICLVDDGCGGICLDNCVPPETCNGGVCGPPPPT